MNGFYAAYLTGREGQGVALLAFKEGKIVGVDGGMKYDGSISINPNGTFACTVNYIIPAGMPLITGPGPVATPTPVSIKFEMPANFADGVIVRIDTPFGPLNAKFVKLADLDL